MGSQRSVIIVGGGIGGLVAALSLHRAGVPVRVYESAREIRALGVGINLLPHAVRELTVLGLAERLAQVGVPTADLAYFTKHGHRIWLEPRGLAAGYRWPQYSIHRGRLQMLLLEALRERLGEHAVLTGHHLESFEERDGRVTARFIDRCAGSFATVHADALIGADGIHSVVRKVFYPDEGAPRFSGRILWRAVTESAPFLTGRSMIMAGHANQKFVAYPISPETLSRGRSLVNWIAELNVGDDEAPMRRDWNRLADKAVFQPAFQSWRFEWLDVPALIAGAAEVFEFPMVDRDPLPRWTFGRVTLLGDAAHPMYPIGSNGASQAILDAGALAAALCREGDIPSALAAYEAARRGPTSELVLSNRRNGPEQVMQLVEERAPNGFERLDDVASQAELEEIANRYKRVAGFDPETLNARASPAGSR